MEPGHGAGREWGWWWGPGGGQRLSESLSERPGLGPGGAAWVTVMRRVLRACASACGALGRECHPPGSPLGTVSKSTEEGNVHPPIHPSAWADLWAGETGPAPLSSQFPALPLSREQRGRCKPCCCQPGSASVAEPFTIPAQSRPKGSFAPAVVAQAGGAGWRSKALPFSQAQARASPRLGPSAIASAVKTGLPLA